MFSQRKHRFPWNKLHNFTSLLLGGDFKLEEEFKILLNKT